MDVKITADDVAVPSRDDDWQHCKGCGARTALGHSVTECLVVLQERIAALEREVEREASR